MFTEQRQCSKATYYQHFRLHRSMRYSGAMDGGAKEEPLNDDEIRRLAALVMAQGEEGTEGYWTPLFDGSDLNDVFLPDFDADPASLGLDLAQEASIGTMLSRPGDSTSAPTFAVSLSPHQQQPVMLMTLQGRQQQQQQDAVMQQRSLVMAHFADSLQHVNRDRGALAAPTDRPYSSAMMTSPALSVLTSAETASCSDSAAAVAAAATRVSYPHPYTFQRQQSQQEVEAFLASLSASSPAGSSVSWGPDHDVDVMPDLTEQAAAGIRVRSSSWITPGNTYPASPDPNEIGGHLRPHSASRPPRARSAPVCRVFVS